MDRYTTVARRIGARWVDRLIFSPLIFINWNLDSDLWPPPLLFGWFCIFAFSQSVYSIVLHKKYGQTIGKRWLRLKVIDYQTQSGINYVQAVARESIEIALALVWLILFAQLMLKGVSFKSVEFWSVAQGTNGLSIIHTLALLIVAKLNQKSRTTHDFIASTVVVRTDAPDSLMETE